MGGSDDGTGGDAGGVQGAPQGRRIWYEFEVQIREQVDRANRPVIAIRDVKALLEERLEPSDDEGLRERQGRSDMCRRGLPLNKRRNRNVRRAPPKGRITRRRNA